jgi:predicted nucleic acid-binding protein
MRDRFFFDTNILLYLYSADEPEKQEISLQAVQACPWPTVSTQTINEFSNTLSRKMKVDWKSIDAALTEIEQTFAIETVTTVVIRKAYIIAERYQYSYYDSAVIASALLCGCARLISEDMQHGQMIEDQLRIVNPFKG